MHKIWFFIEEIIGKTIQKQPRGYFSGGSIAQKRENWTFGAQNFEAFDDLCHCSNLRVPSVRTSLSFTSRFRDSLNANLI